MTKNTTPTNHAYSVASFDISGIGAEFEESVSGVGPFASFDNQHFMRGFG